MVKMKESGIGLLGLIPEDWKVTKLKYEFDFGKGLPITKDNLIEEGLPVISYGQIHSKLNNGTSINPSLLRFVKPYYKFTNPQSQVFKGDFIFADTSEDLEGCGNAVLKCDEDDLYAGYHSIIMHAKRSEYSKYLAYLFLTNEWRSQLRSRVSGVKVLSVTQTIFKFASIILPPLETQKRIVDFLDRKCSKIDSLRNDIQKQIEVLEQYKKSVITETVTKGINPNVKMKDSGIEWIGEIPEHWEIHPIYYYFEERKHKNSLCKEQNLLSLSYGNVIRKDINALGGLLPESFNTYNIIEKDDIVIRPTDLQNDKRSLRTGLCKEHGIITSAYITLKPKKNVNSQFYHYLLHSYDIEKVFYNMGNGVRQGLNYSEFKKLLLISPTFDEQKNIVEYLDSKCLSIDNIINSKKQQLEKLEEYKKSLIFEYVTGKREV
jgi:type I restriction enzyme S subunit